MQCVSLFAERTISVMRPDAPGSMSKTVIKIITAGFTRKDSDFIVSYILSIL